MNRKAMLIVAGIVVCAAGALRDVAAAADAGPFGPPPGVKADVVRSFAMKVSGAVAADVKGKKGDGKTGLVGQCKPTMFANFGILHGNSYDHVEITLMTKNPIPTGTTGDIKLEKVWVRFYDLKNEARSFGGKGMLKLAAHDGSPGKRRMTGTIVGTKLGGEEKLKGKFIDVTASFDMDFSCGVK